MVKLDSNTLQSRVTIAPNYIRSTAFNRPTDFMEMGFGYETCRPKETLNISTRVEAGSNTSTVTLRVVRGDEMGLKKAAP
jgi:hypothetical protein